MNADKNRDKVAGKIPAEDRPVQPAAEVVDMEVRLPIRRQYTPAQKESLKSIGVTELHLEHMGALSMLGQAARDCGVIETIKGCTFFSQDQLVKVMQKAQTVLEARSTHHINRLRAADVIVRAARAMSFVNTSAVKMDQTVIQAVVQEDEFRRRSFQPGMAVKQAKATTS